MIYYKPEEASTALPIGANSTSDEPIDGVATHKHKDQVFKAVTGTKVTVGDDGGVNADFSLGQMAIGGWKDKEWLAGRHALSTPDNGWDSLFSKAAIIVPPPTKPNVFEDMWQKGVKGLHDLEKWGK